MSNQTTAKKNQLRRKNRIRAKVVGTAQRPRLSVHISHQHVSAQIIDDEKHNTLASITTVGKKNVPSNLTERAKWAGTEIVKGANKAKVKKVVLDRNGKLYHGRIKAFAEAAREKGLEF